MTDRAAIELADERQRSAADPAASAWVAASAGTGKTKVLTDRVLNLMLNGTEPSRILCLTFTKEAAAEMANRIAARLALWTAAPDMDTERGIQALTGQRPQVESWRRGRQPLRRRGSA